MTRRSARLSFEELASYRENGFVIRREALSAATCSGLMAAAERVNAWALKQSASGRRYRLDGNLFADVGATTIQHELDGTGAAVRVVEPLHERDAVFDRLADHPALVEPMRQILGSSKLSLWTSKLNLKPAGGSGFGWHQDSPYWVHDHDSVGALPNVMVAIDDSAQGSGCFRVIPGSHHNGCLPGLEDGTQLEGFFTHPRYIDESESVAFQAPAGSVMFFSPHLVHGSPPNRSERSRRAAILTYQLGHRPSLKSGRLRPIGPPGSNRSE